MYLRTFVFLVIAISLHAEEFVIWQEGEMDRIRKDTKPSSNGEVQLYAARNEIEPFQIGIRGTLDDRPWVDIRLEPFKNETGHAFYEAKIYEQFYVEVKKPTPYSPFEAGAFPDPLVPVSKNRISPKSNQIAIWVDVSIPKNTPAGNYTSRIHVSLPSGVSKSIPIKLVVWNFTLPDVPNLKSSFGVDWRRIAKAYGLSDREDSKKLSELTKSYYDFLSAHRLSPELLYGCFPVATREHTKVSFRRSTKPALGTPEDMLKYYLGKQHMASIALPFWPDYPFHDPLVKDRAAAKKYVADYVEYVANHGFGNRIYSCSGFIDEPNDAEAYERVREWGRFFNEVEQEYQVKIPMLATEQPKPDRYWWGSLQGSVDIWSPLVAEAYKDLEYEKTNLLQQRIKAGEEVWPYPALVQVPHEWLKQNGNPKVLHESNPPVWQLDFPSMNYRVLSWINALYGFHGILYWSTIWWEEGVDVWEYTGNFIHPDGNVPFNGDGLLIYPGRAERVGFDGPVASIRLKWIRESVDDFDYIALLRNKGFKSEAREAIQMVARGMGDWKQDPDTLEKARIIIGNLLHENANH